MQPGDRIGGRYVVEHELGAGAAGHVYRCLDTHLQAPVAVKFLNAASAGPAAIERAGLLAFEHPALVRMLDSGTQDGQSYVVSEFAAGGSLAAVVKPLAGPLLQQLATQMLDALAFLHGHGILHGDVKTENIFVTSREPPAFKLGDFGLSRRIKDITAGDAAGSPAFMPPEVIRGEPADERSDLYALGVVLYECAFGQLPFAGATVTEVFRGHLNDEPAGLQSPGAVHPREAALLRRLLAKDPAARPRDARAALALWRGEEAALPESAPRRLGVMIGRDRELAACERALEGTAQIVLLEGTPGVGKTRLLHEAAMRARLRDHRVVWWTPDVVSGDVIEPANGSVADVHAGNRKRDARDWALDRAAALLEQLGSGGWALFVDDLDSAPVGFVQSVVTLCRTVVTSRAARCAVYLASRTPAIAVEQGLVDLPAGAVVRLTLQDWHADIVSQALSALYGARSIDRALSSFVLEATGGNPALVENLAPQLITHHALRVTPSGQLTVAAGITAQSWSGSPESWVQDALAGLAPEHARLLDALCALQSPAGVDVLRHLVPTLEAGLAALVRAGLVHPIPGEHPAYAPSSAMLRRRVLTALDPSQRARLHADLLAALQTQPHADGAELAYHRAMCADETNALSALDQLAALASPDALLAVLDQLGETIAQHLGRVDRMQWILLRLDALRRAGDLCAVRDLVGAELRTSPPESRVQLACYLADAQMELGETEAALRSLQQLKALDDPGVAARAGRALWLLRRYDEGLQVTLPALNAIDPGDARFHPLAESHVALLRGSGNTNEASALMTKAASLAAAEDKPRELALHLVTLGQIEFYRGRFPDADAKFQQAVEILSQIGDRVWLLRALTSLAASSGESGRYSESREHLMRAIDLSRSLGEFRNLFLAHANLAQLYFILAQYNDSLDQVRQVLRLSERVPNQNAEHSIRIVEAHVCCRIGDYARAWSTLDRLLERSPDPMISAQAYLCQAHVLLATGTPNDAASALDLAVPLFQRCQADDELLEVLLCRARVAAAAHQMDHALTQAHEVVRLAAQAGAWLMGQQGNVVLAEITLSFDTDIAARLAAECLPITDRHGLREESWRLHKVIGGHYARQGETAAAAQEYRQAWRIVEEIVADLDESVATSYLNTPEVHAFITGVQETAGQ